MKKLFFFVLIISCCWTNFSWSGMLIVQRDSSGQYVSWACEDGLFRFGTEDVYTIIDTNKEVFYTVMVTDRLYTMTTVKEIQEQMEQIKRSMKAMENLADSFKGLEKFWDKKEIKPGVPSSASKITYKYTGKKDHLAGYKVYKIIVLQDGHPISELWISKDLVREVNQTCNYQKLEEMLKVINDEDMNMSISQRNGQNFFIPKGKDIAGFPLKIIDLQNGNIIQVIKVEKKKLPRSYFQIPPNFKRVNYKAAPMSVPPF